MEHDPSNDTTSSAPVFSRLIEHAIEVSAQWHDRTYRKSRWRDPAFEVPAHENLGVPVMAHVAAVAVTVQRAGWGDAAVAGAFLHDVLEDVNFWGDHLSLDSLVALVGNDVANLVRCVSEQKFDEVGAPILWRARKEAYIDAIKSAPPGAVAISLADKLHNLWSINESLSLGIDVFRDGKNRKGLGADAESQYWFFSEVVAASQTCSDPRLTNMRSELLGELRRFGDLVRIDNRRQ